MKNVVRIVEELDLINDKESINRKGRDVLAIIPFKGKDIEVDGFSFLKKTIEDAVSSKKISEIVVNCDDKETLEKALKYGAHHALVRTDDANDSLLGINTILKESLNYVDPLREKFNRIIFLSSTYPYRENSLLDNILSEFDSGSYGYLDTCNKRILEYIKRE